MSLTNIIDKYIIYKDCEKHSIYFIGGILYVIFRSRSVKTKILVTYQDR